SADSESVRTLKNLAVRRGGSLSVPCFYDKQYKLNHKYWCRGYFWSSCGIVAYTNTSGGTSVTDHPTQNMFTVELNSLQDSDSGYYWCAVEIGGFGTPDDRDYVYLTVSADPAVWVENSRVSGQEGGSVSVQCFYSAEYKNEEKKWCRFTDWSCYTFPNSAVKISDDGRRSFRVEMSGLQKSDAGWYWFSAGDVGVTVHLSVTEENWDPDLSVKESSVSGQEGGSVSVQCPYSAGYQKEQKQWCRSKGRCYTVGRTNTGQGSAVQISDDGRRSFGVEMSGLQKSDAGWFWCKTGKLQIPVHLVISSELKPRLQQQLLSLASTQATVRNSETMMQVPYSSGFYWL
ncbi:polymeric immunoglobulin receptor-like, partial [Salminus brasiliensis]|uniref:polymeric immunoglobulin receptor-like n=1 Tax=Salminus brasiliensis TaxID=930266 RepID=UPI003B82FEF0